MNDTSYKQEITKEDKLLELAKPILYGSKSTAINNKNADSLMKLLDEITNIFDEELDEKDLKIESLETEITFLREVLREITKHENRN